MQTFEEVLTHFHSFLESATYLDVVPCRWGYVRLFNEGDPINSMQFFAAHHKNYIRHWQMIWKQRFRSAWESTELV